MKGDAAQLPAGDLFLGASVHLPVRERQGRGTVLSAGNTTVRRLGDERSTEDSRLELLGPEEVRAPLCLAVLT